MQEFQDYLAELYPDMVGTDWYRRNAHRYFHQVSTARRLRAAHPEQWAQVLLGVATAMRNRFEREAIASGGGSSS